MKFNVREMKYLGHLITSEGLKPDPGNISAILKMTELNDVKSLSNTNILRELKVKGIPCEWQKKH